MAYRVTLLAVVMRYACAGLDVIVPALGCLLYLSLMMLFFYLVLPPEADRVVFLTICACLTAVGFIQLALLSRIVFPRGTVENILDLFSTRPVSRRMICTVFFWTFFATNLLLSIVVLALYTLLWGYRPCLVVALWAVVDVLSIVSATYWRMHFLPRLTIWPVLLILPFMCAVVVSALLLPAAVSFLVGFAALVISFVWCKNTCGRRR